MTRQIRLKLKADFSDVLRGRRWIHPTVGPAGEAVLLVADEADVPVVMGYEEHPGGARFPRTRTQSPVTATVIIQKDCYIRRVPLPHLELAHTMVRPLPGDEILVVGARCRRFPDGTAERNARVYGADGDLEREFVLGDGIQEVQVTVGGDIWVSYFDEGIFGNYGWRGSADATPLGASGLVRFDAAGAKLWEYRPPEGFNSMADCYALNVADDATWAYYYTDFPLVRIEPDGRVRGWNTGVAGANAFAVDGRRVLLFGGYPPHRNRCMLGRLGDHAVEDAAEYRLALPSGEPLDEGQAVGRGPILHVFAGTSWYQIDMRDL